LSINPTGGAPSPPKLRKRYKIALAVLGWMMFGPGVLGILALIKYLDSLDVAVGGLASNDTDLLP